MPALAQLLMQKLHGQDIYAGFRHQDIAPDMHGGGGNPFFEPLIDALRPGLIIEVGTWKGSSAIRMAELLRAREIDGTVVCVDTWLGGLDHILNPMAPEWDIGRYRTHGYPALYYQFLANVVHAGCQDYIVPFPNTSAIAARWLDRLGLRADLVYVDASHDEEDVYRDVVDYWKVLRPGGVMLGDDWSDYWPGVVQAVTRFSQEQGLPLHTEDVNWMLIKPPATPESGPTAAH